MVDAASLPGSSIARSFAGSQKQEQDKTTSPARNPIEGSKIFGHSLRRLSWS